MWGVYSMAMKQTTVLVLGILLSYLIVSAISSGILCLWVMLADWLRDELGFSLLRTVLTMGMIGGILGLFRAIPSLQRMMNEQSSDR